MTDTADAAAELAIRNLIARMAHAAGSGEIADYAEMTVADAYWQLPSGDPLIGHAAILEGASARRASGAVGPGTGTRHMITTTWVEVVGDSARARSHWLFVGNTATGPVLHLAGSYADTFRRTDAGWRFTKRIASID